VDDGVEERVEDDDVLVTRPLGELLLPVVLRVVDVLVVLLRHPDVNNNIQDR